MTRLAWLARGLLIAVLALGCKPQIGDKCSVSTNCSTTGDRLCDVTQPDGYCTKFNCEPGSCPEDSVCVNFGTTLSIIDEYDGSCTPSQGNSPYKRSFCMANCSSNSDCRPGYECLAAGDLNAVLAEYSSDQRVCGVRPKQEPTKEQNSDQVCNGSDAGPPEGGSSSTGGAGGGAGANEGGSSSSGSGGALGGDGGDGGASGDGGAAANAGAGG